MCCAGRFVAVTGLLDAAAHLVQYVADLLELQLRPRGRLSTVRAARLNARYESPGGGNTQANCSVGLFPYDGEFSGFREQVAGKTACFQKVFKLVDVTLEFPSGLLQLVLA